MKNKLKKYLPFTILIFITIFLRFYNLNTTARFTRDESSDLVRIKQIIDNKDITLIGPIAEGNTGIFSSLTYYISLPFVYLSGFKPVGPVLATAFYGTITVILIFLFFKKQKNIWPLIFLLPVTLSPLVEISRWAWNPHFIPFWQIVGILTLYSPIPINLLITGFLFGLTIHQHWYAIFSCAGLAVLIFIQNKKIKPVIKFLSGIFISLLPFVLFDLTHPPGLFITRMLYFSPVSLNQSFHFSSFFQKLIIAPYQFTDYLTYHQTIFTWLIITLTLILIINNICQKYYKNNFFLIPVLFQFLGLSLISDPIVDRYLIPGILFFLIWLTQNSSKIIAKIIITLLIFSSFLSLPKILRQNNFNTNIQALTNITQIIENQINSNDKFNLVVLQSPDQNTKGLRFRDLLKIDNIQILPPEDYSNPDILFVITYSDNWEKIKTDPAYEMDHFRKNQPDNIWKIENSQWILYQINK